MIRRFVMHPSTWGVPFVVLLALGALLPAIYLTATIDPQKNLDHFPIAVVLDPQTAQTADSPAAALANAITSTIDHDKFDVRALSVAEADKQMDNGTLYGAVRIPGDFDSSIGALLQPSASDDSGSDLSLPVVELETNPRIGGITASLFTGNLSPMIAGVEKAFGAKLIQAVGANANVSTPTQRLALATPFRVTTTPHHPLPDGSGLGTSAFYYALLLVLLGFLGASMIHPTVDSATGFTPNEVGPLVSRRPYLRFSRLSTLLAKFAVMSVSAPLAAAVMILVAGPVLGMPIGHPMILWLFSCLTVLAVGLSALTVFAVFGSVGALVNMLFFVALAMTSSGGTIPIEAAPPFFRWISRFEPMRAIVEGTKSILYFDATSVSGLSNACLRVGVGGAVGIVLGLALTSWFDRRPKLARHPIDPDETGMSGVLPRAQENHGRHRREQTVGPSWAPRSSTSPSPIPCVLPSVSRRSISSVAHGSTSMAAADANPRRTRSSSWPRTPVGDTPS